MHTKKGVHSSISCRHSLITSPRPLSSAVTPHRRSIGINCRPRPAQACSRSHSNSFQKIFQQPINVHTSHGVVTAFEAESAIALEPKRTCSIRGNTFLKRWSRSRAKSRNVDDKKTRIIRAFFLAALSLVRSGPQYLKVETQKNSSGQ